jgi:hypothetical protein
VQGEEVLYKLVRVTLAFANISGELVVSCGCWLGAQSIWALQGFSRANARLGVYLGHACVNMTGAPLSSSRASLVPPPSPASVIIISLMKQCKRLRMPSSSTLAGRCQRPGKCQRRIHWSNPQRLCSQNLNLQHYHHYVRPSCSGSLQRKILHKFSKKLYTTPRCCLGMGKNTPRLYSILGRIN